MHKTLSRSCALSGLLLWLMASAVHASPACDDTAIKALLPAFRMPADVHMTWTEGGATQHVSSQYFLLHSDRSLSRNDPNGISQIFEAQLQMLGWHESSSDTENEGFTSAWTLRDARCGTLQVTFDLLRVENKADGYFGAIQIMRP